MNEEKKYGLIVIGGGMTGLSTALTWALNHDLKKDRVLLIEKEPKTGGYVTIPVRPQEGGFYKNQHRG